MSTSFPETIPELVEQRAAASPSAAWLLYEGDTWSLPDVVELYRRAATGLAERGVVRGDRVAVLLGNRPETLTTWFAASFLGASFVPLNPALTPAELARYLALVRPRVLVADDLRAQAESACAPLEPATRPALCTPTELLANAPAAGRSAATADDTAVLIATSGTTGTPKAVEQTQRAFTLTAEAFPAWLGLGPSDRLLAALPLFHINAQAYSTLGALGCGASLALLPRFSASRFWSEAARLGATEVNLVGAMVHILMSTAPSAAERAHRLRICYAALALPEAVHRAFEARFGLEMLVGYGMSETTFGTIWPLGEPPRFGTMGRLRQHPRLGTVSRARVVRDDGSDAACGETGELWLSGPATMRGYFGEPEATNAALRAGWLHTGDLVKCDDDGFFTFVARKKDILRRRGENVAPAEIETALLDCPGVAEAAVVGEPSALGEDEIIAYVAPQPGAVLDPHGLRTALAERLASFKLPSEIRVRDSLPKTATARIAKHLLR